MIAFDLECAMGHAFEGWFEDGAAYESQREAGLIACPICENTQVSKKFSTFAIRASTPSAPPAEKGAGEADALIREISSFVEKNFDNVGADFAREALKIHYGVSEPRNIRGSSTREEEKTLRDEGVKFYKFPVSEPDQ